MCGILFRFLTLLVPSCRIFQHQFLGPPQAFFFSQVVLLERAPGNGTRVLRKEPLLFREGVQCKNYGIQFGSASRVVYHLAPAEAEVSLWGKPLDLGTELKRLDLGYRYDLCFYGRGIQLYSELEVLCWGTPTASHTSFWVSQAVLLWVAISHVCSPSCLIRGWRGVFFLLAALAWPSSSERREGQLQPLPLTHRPFLSFPKIKLWS